MSHWKPAYRGLSGSEARQELARDPLAPLQKAQPAQMAEPRHRVGPPGVSSGVSLRKFPRSTIAELRKICEHYEAKCGGKYASRTPAARYLFQMSREIVSQLAALEVWLQEKSKLAASMKEERKQWDEHFSPSAKQRLLAGLPNAAFATPKEIADYIRQIQGALDEHRRTADAAKANARTEVENLQRVLATHRTAARVQAAEDRARHRRALAKAEAEARQVAQELRAQYDASVESLRGKLEVDLVKLRRDLEEQTTLFEAQRASDEAEFHRRSEAAESRMTSEVEQQVRHRTQWSDDELGSLRRRLAMAQAALREAKSRRFHVGATPPPRSPRAPSSAAVSDARSAASGPPAGPPGTPLASVASLTEELGPADARVLGDAERLLSASETRVSRLMAANERLRARVAELEDVVDALQAAGGAVVRSGARVVQVAAAERNLQPKTWHAENVPMGVGALPDAPVDWIGAAGRPKWAQQPWTRSRGSAGDPRLAFSQPGTPSLRRAQERKVRDYCEQQRRNHGAPFDPDRQLRENYFYEEPQADQAEGDAPAAPAEAAAEQQVALESAQEIAQGAVQQQAEGPHGAEAPQGAGAPQGAEAQPESTGGLCPRLRPRLRLRFRLRLRRRFRAGGRAAAHPVHEPPARHHGHGDAEAAGGLRGRERGEPGRRLRRGRRRDRHGALAEHGRAADAVRGAGALRRPAAVHHPLTAPSRRPAGRRGAGGLYLIAFHSSAASQRAPPRRGRKGSLGPRPPRDERAGAILAPRPADPIGPPTAISNVKRHAGGGAPGWLNVRRLACLLPGAFRQACGPVPPRALILPRRGER